jgi:uncharacterized protein YfaS (alpha-2-macroglobulin family)
MANGLYDPGSTIRLGANFRSQGSFADPTTVTLKVKDPTGVVTTYTHPADLTKDAVGRYHRDLTPNTPGTWYYRFIATGAVAATIEESFRVRETVIAA